MSTTEVLPPTSTSLNPFSPSNPGILNNLTKASLSFLIVIVFIGVSFSIVIFLILFYTLQNRYCPTHFTKISYIRDPVQIKQRLAHLQQPVRPTRFAYQKHKVTVSNQVFNTFYSHLEYDERENESCSICLEALLRVFESTKLRTCNHLFHKKCIKKWLMDFSIYCPICKQFSIPLEHLEDFIILRIEKPMNGLENVQIQMKNEIELNRNFCFSNWRRKERTSNDESEEEDEFEVVEMEEIQIDLIQSRREITDRTEWHQL